MCLTNTWLLPEQLSESRVCCTSHPYSLLRNRVSLPTQDTSPKEANLCPFIPVSVQSPQNYFPHRGYWSAKKQKPLIIWIMLFMCAKFDCVGQWRPLMSPAHRASSFLNPGKSCRKNVLKIKLNKLIKLKLIKLKKFRWCVQWLSSVHAYA